MIGLTSRELRSCAVQGLPCFMAEVGLAHGAGLSGEERAALSPGILFSLLPVPCIGRVAFGGEHAQAVPPPACAEVARVFVAITPKLAGEVQQRAEQGSAVIVHQLD